MKIKLMTFNIQHCRNYNRRETEVIDFRAVADTILRYEPDIVGLNEVRGAGEVDSYVDQTGQLAALTGYNSFFAPALYVPGRGPYGNALLTRFGISSAEAIPIPDPADKVNGRGFESRCILKAVIEAGSPVAVFVTHFGLNPSESESALLTAQRVLGETELPKILMGDFNLVPENPVLDRIRLTMADTAGMFPEPKFSFPSDNPTQKIDYIFVSDDIEVISADIPEVVVSDHRPHIATVQI